MKIREGLPPRRFKPAGVVMWGAYSPTPPPFISNKRKYKGRRADGIRYEAKVHKTFEAQFGAHYVASPWFRFQELGVDKVRWCQPDALLFDFEKGQITLIECKLQHTADAWWQLRWLYLPVLAKVFPGNLWKISLIEVVKWYDPAVAFPEEVRLRASVQESKTGEFGVHILKP